MSASGGKKSLLKAAKEALAAKSYRDALTHCKAVLAEDKGCYDAFVLIGKAAFFLKEFQQAEAAYKRASELDANNMMAWQGFAELYSETGQWANAASAYAALVNLASVHPDEAVKARGRQFLRKQAESAAKSTNYEEAEDCYRQLLSSATDGMDRLELLCLLADVQLGFDRQEVESRVQARMASAAAAGEVVSEAVLRQAVEAEWAEEGLEMETDHASAALREIVAEAPPSPRFAPYYEAYLRRLRKYVYSAAPSSSERHNRRIAVLQFCRFMIAGRSGAGVAGGCCSATPFASALAMLEIEGEVAPPAPASRAEGSTPGSPHKGDAANRKGTPLALDDSNTICQRLAFTFPWSPEAGVHLALAMRRRALLGPCMDKPCRAPGSSKDPARITLLAGPTTNGQPPAPPTTAHRKFMLRELLAGLKRGVSSAAGWLAAAEMLLEKHQQLQQQSPSSPQSAALTSTAQAALDAAKEGLKYVAHRDFLGKEHMEQAGLLLRLAAARALLALGAHHEAEALLLSLAERVSEGRATFGLLAGVAPVSVSQQAVRLLAQSALAQGDRSSARRLYESLVGRGALGRNAEGAEPWAHAEYGWMMMEEGELEVAHQQLEEAVALMQQQLGAQAAQGQQAQQAAAELAATRLKLAQVYWALGGELRSGKGVGAHAALLACAAVEGPHQAQAFSWLGRWYWEVAADEPRARKCYQRALALDPVASEQAGEALVALLVEAHESALALELCRETTASSPGALWAWRCLANLQLSAGNAEAAVAAFQRALRATPSRFDLWRGLGAAYQGLGRHTAALKAFLRALELQPSCVYCLLQCASIQQQLGALNQADEAFRRALALSPGHPAALLGSAEAKLSSAQLHWRLGAGGVAALELAAAAHSAAECAATNGQLQLAWKLLGDALLQQAGVTPLPQLRALAAAPPGQGAAAAATRAVQARVDAVRAARVAYCKALHLDPTQGAVWGDAAVTAHQEASLTRLLACTPLSASAAPPPPGCTRESLLALAQRLVQGGLQLEPGSDWLWSCAGAVADDSPERREFCWTRALQLNPKRAVTWAALGRLYTQKGNGVLAQQCFESARSHEPTLVCVWEAMANLSSTASQAPGDVAYTEMMDAYQHAVGLGGGMESRLAYATDALKTGTGGMGEVFAAASKCCQQLPTLAAAHNALGLAAEARGHVEQAIAAFETALALLPSADDINGSPATATGVGSAGALDEDVKVVTAYLGVGPGSSAMGLQTAGAGPRDPLVLRAAVRLNLARALAKHGQEEPDSARRAVAVYRELQAEGWMQGDHMAWLAYAAALERAGGAGDAAQVSDALHAALAAAGSEQEVNVGNKAEVEAAVALRRLSCALTLCKQLVQEGDWGTAHRVVQQEAKECVSDERCVSLALQLWLALLAGATAAEAGGPEAPAGFRQVLVEQLLEWADVRRDVVNDAEVRAHVSSMEAAMHAASGQTSQACKAAAAAVHLCPADPRWRLQLASYALSATPANALAAARASRLDTQQQSPSMGRLAPIAPATPTPVIRPTAILRPVVLGTPIAAPAPSSSVKSQTPAPSTALGPSIPALWPGHPGDAHIIRASGLVSTLPIPQLEAAFEAEVLRLTHLVHTHPDSTVGWYLLGLVSLQRAAAAPGQQCRLYRHALVRCKAALARVQTLHAQLQPSAASATAATAVPSLPLAAMVQAAAEAAMARQREKAALSSKDQALQQLCASMVLRLLAASSECHLYTRLPGCKQAAKDAANQALQWAVQQQLNPALAQRQMGRVLWALGDMNGAELALSQAAKSEDFTALVECASLLASTGQEEAARQLLSSALQGGSLADKPSGSDPQVSSLMGAAALLPAKLLLDLQELEAARQLLVDELLQQGPTAQQQGGDIGKVPAGAVAAALALQARVALQGAASEEGEAVAAGGEVSPAAKRLVLEARWAASGSTRQLQATGTTSGYAGEEAALVHLLLGQAELARGRMDKAVEDLGKAVMWWSEPKPVDLLSQFQGVAGNSATQNRAAVARAVRMEPWNMQSWQKLRTPAAVTADA